MSTDHLAAQVGATLGRQNKVVVTAESCTGGWIAKRLTDVPGCSAWFERGFVVYGNAAKREMLGVADDTLSTFGAVSGETVTEMAQGALARSPAQIALAVSGVAGPGGGSESKPVGTVWLAVAPADGDVSSRRHLFGGDREAIRTQAADAALLALLGVLDALGDPN